MSTDFLKGEISEKQYRKFLPELLEKAAKINQETCILSVTEDEGADSLEKYLGYNCVHKHHYTLKDDSILEEIEIVVIPIEIYDDRQREITYIGRHPDRRLNYIEFVNILTKENLKKVAEKIVELGFN